MRCLPYRCGVLQFACVLSAAVSTDILCDPIMLGGACGWSTLAGSSGPAQSRRFTKHGGLQCTAWHIHACATYSIRTLPGAIAIPPALFVVTRHVGLAGRANSDALASCFALCYFSCMALSSCCFCAYAYFGSSSVVSRRCPSCELRFLLDTHVCAHAWQLMLRSSVSVRW